MQLAEVVTGVTAGSGRTVLGKTGQPTSGLGEGGLPAFARAFIEQGQAGRIGMLTEASVATHARVLTAKIGAEGKPGSEKKAQLGAAKAEGVIVDPLPAMTVPETRRDSLLPVAVVPTPGSGQGEEAVFPDAGAVAGSTFSKSSRSTAPIAEKIVSSSVKQPGTAGFYPDAGAGTIELETEGAGTALQIQRVGPEGSVPVAAQVGLSSPVLARDETLSGGGVPASVPHSLLSPARLGQPATQTGGGTASRLPGREPALARSPQVDLPGPFAEGFPSAAGTRPMVGDAKPDSLAHDFAGQASRSEGSVGLEVGRRGQGNESLAENGRKTEAASIPLTAAESQSAFASPSESTEQGLPSTTLRSVAASFGSVSSAVKLSTTAAAVAGPFLGAVHASGGGLSESAPGGNLAAHPAHEGAMPGGTSIGGLLPNEGARGESTNPRALSEDAFGQMDAGGLSAPHLLRSAPRMMEIGVNDPAHGWLEVRAEGGAGQVVASLNPASPEAHAALHAQLQGLAEYLSERAIGVRSVAVGHAQGEAGTAMQSGAGSRGGEGREFTGNGNAGSGGGSNRGTDPGSQPRAGRVEQRISSLPPGPAAQLDGSAGELYRISVRV